MTKIEKNNTNPVATLQAQAAKFDFSQLSADKSNVGANSGKQTYLDFLRMDFVINGKVIDEKFVTQLCDKHNDLATNDKDKNYRILAKQIFTEMFKHAGAKIPSDSIIEELITHCNQSGYVGSLLGNESKPLTKVSFEYNDNLHFQSIDYTIYINCDNTNRATIRVKEPISIRVIDNPQEEMHMDSSLEFTLESQDGKEGVTYKDGKLLLTVPKELKNYKAGDKNLFDAIKEYFQKLCEKLGFKFETKIEHNFSKPSAEGHLDKVEQPVNGISTTKWYVD